MRTIEFLTIQLLGVLFLLNCSEAEMCAGCAVEKVDPNDHEIRKLLMCPGCIQDTDPNDPEIRKELVVILAAQSEESDIIKVIKARTQVVSGARYIVDFEVKDRRTNQVKLCHTSYISQPWRYKLPWVQQFLCHNK